MTKEKERREYDRLYRQQHRDELNAKSKLYYQQHRSECRANRKLHYEKHKAEEQAYQKAYYYEHDEELQACRRQQRHQQHEEIKLLVLEHYSNGIPYCKHCGQTDIDVLCLDHVNNDGAEQRRKFGGWSGTGFYRWLTRNNFPLGYQVLCANCNLKKEIERRRKEAGVLKTSPLAGLNVEA